MQAHLSAGLGGRLPSPLQLRLSGLVCTPVAVPHAPVYTVLSRHKRCPCLEVPSLILCLPRSHSPPKFCLSVRFFRLPLPPLSESESDLTCCCCRQVVPVVREHMSWLDSRGRLLTWLQPSVGRAVWVLLEVLSLVPATMSGTL